MGETLDRAYLTIEDFLNSRHIRSDDIDHARTPDSLQFHFNKPGFDLAIILTDKSLIPTISVFQAPFQSKHGLTTHVIYLPDISRLKFCIRDLKLHEILYAIVVSEDSQRRDEYDLFILSDIIELQKSMNYEEGVRLICDDFNNYMTQMKTMLNSPARYPHARSQNIDGFIEPSDSIRYLLCLLFDHRMLETDELRALSSFVSKRKEALVRSNTRPVDYAINERPVPPYRQDKLKYYVYEHNQELLLPNKEERMGLLTTPNRRQEMAASQPDSDLRMAQPPVGHPRQYPGVPVPKIPNNTPLLQYQQQQLPHQQQQLHNTTFSKSAIIASSPILYPNPSVPRPTANPSVPRPTANASVPRPASNASVPRPTANPSVPRPTANPILPRVTPPKPPNFATPIVIKPPLKSQTNIGIRPQVPKITPPSFTNRAPIPPAISPALASVPKFQSPANTIPRLPGQQIITSKNPLQSTNTANIASQASKKIKFAITPTAKPAPITHSNVAHKPQTSDLAESANKGVSSGDCRGGTTLGNNTAQRTESGQSIPIMISGILSSPGVVSALPLERSKSNNSSHSDNLSDFETDDYNTMYQLSPVSSNSPDRGYNQDGPTVAYTLSQMSDEDYESEENQGPMIEIDLTDDVVDHAGDTIGQCPPPTKKSKYSPVSQALSKPDQPGTYVLNLSEDNPSVQLKANSITCNGLVYFFKFALNLAPLSLPEHNVVIVLMKKCLLDMERYVQACGLVCVEVDIRACRTGGCLEIIKIIETLCGEAIASKHNVSDLNFMWTYFPKNRSDHSITIMFYKLMKMLELCKLVPASNAILVNLLQRLERVAYFNFQLSDSNRPSYTILNFFPSLFSEYFSMTAELHTLNASLPAPETPMVSFNPDLDMTVMDNKIKFVVGPVLELFIQTINSVHHDLTIEQLEVVYGAIRTTRLCFRRISTRLLPDKLKKPINFISPANGIDRTLELLDEVNLLVREVAVLNCLLFTRKHYELVMVLLDFSVEVKRVVDEGCDQDMDDSCKESIIQLDVAKFVTDFSTTITTAVLGYHPDTEVDMFKTALKNRWIDTLHQAFKGLEAMTEGSRIAIEMEYLLPKCWGKHTFGEAVTEAAQLSYCDWDKMLTNDFSRARVKYSDVRNNYLVWLSNNGLDHRKAMEAMTSYQKTLDAKILQMSS